jgi:hypothetical protein
MCPHGGYPTVGIFIVILCALIATIYGASSCRFMVVTYSSDQGSLEESFSDFSSREGQDASIYKSGIGLFQFLRPSNPLLDSEDSWYDGYCVGYTQGIRSAISDGKFEAARAFAVLAVILGFCITVFWFFVVPCFSMNQYQIWIMTFCLFFGTLSVCLTFMIRSSAICSADSGVFLTQSCDLDEGGLAMVAAILLWLSAVAIQLLYIRLSEFDDPSYINNSASELTDSTWKDSVQRRISRFSTGTLFEKKSSRLAKSSSENTTRTLASTPPSGLDRPQEAPEQLPVPSDSSTDTGPQHISSQSLVEELRGPSFDDVSEYEGSVMQYTHGRSAASANSDRITVDDRSSQKEFEVFVSPPRYTVDDVSNQEELEVYEDPATVHRLERIDSMASDEEKV